MIKKVSVLVIAFVFLLSTFSVYADSGASAIPKDSTWKQYVYKYIAPKTQTSFKTIHSQDVPVKKLIKEHDKIKADLSNCMSVGGIISITNPGVAIIADIGSAGLYTMYLLDDKVIVKSLKKIKENTKIHSDIQFKWTNASKLRYEMKITYYAKYRGHMINSTKKTKKVTGTFMQ